MVNHNSLIATSCLVIGECLPNVLLCIYLIIRVAGHFPWEYFNENQKKKKKPLLFLLVCFKTLFNGIKKEFASLSHRKKCNITYYLHKTGL